MTDLDIFWPEALKQAREQGRMQPEAVSRINRLLKRNLLATAVVWMFLALFGQFWITILILAFIIPVMRFDVSRFAQTQHLVQEGDA